MGTMIVLPSQGLVGGPVNWVLEELGRLVLRVRPAAGAGPTAWYLLTPIAPNTIAWGSHTITVSVGLALAAGAEIGANISVAGGGATDVELTLFVNVSAGGAPSFLFYQLIAAAAQPLPSKTTAGVTLPVSGLVNVTRLQLALAATGVTGPLVAGGGRINVPAMQVDAALGFGLTQLVSAVSQLGARLATFLASVSSLLGVALSPLGVLTGTLPATAKVDVPSRDADQPALSDASVISMTSVTAAISKGAAPTFDLGSTTVDIAFTAPATAADPAVDSYRYQAPAPVDAALVLLAKTPQARDNLTLSTLDAQLNATGLPTDLSFATAQMPPIAKGAPSPDPALAAPVVDYRADARLPSLVGLLRSHAVAADPMQPAPGADACLRFELTDLPRAAHVRSGQFDPNRPDDTYVEGGFADGAGMPDAAARIAVALRPGMLMPAAPAGAAQTVGSDAASGLVSAVLGQLQRGEVRIESGSAGAPPHPQTRTRASYAAAAALPAAIHLTSAGGDTLDLAVDALPTSFALDLSLPELTPAFDAKADWNLAASWNASGKTGHVAVNSAHPAPPTAESSSVSFEVRDLPAALSLNAGNVSGVLDAVLDAGSEQTGAVDLVLKSSRLAAIFPTLKEVFSQVEVHASSVPAWAEASVNRSLAKQYLFIYRASHPIDLVTLYSRDNDLVAPPADGKPAYDHLEVRLQKLPGTPGAGPPSSAHASFPIAGAVDSSVGVADAPPIVKLYIPGGGPPLGSVEVEITDAAARMAPGMPVQIEAELISRFAYADPSQDPMPADAPRGRRVRAAAPGLRWVEFDQRTVNPQASIAAAAPRPLWLKAVLDAAVPVGLNIAGDSKEAALIGTTWARAALDPISQAVVDGRLDDGDGQQIFALETYGRGVAATGSILGFDASSNPFFDGYKPFAADAAELRKSRIDFKAVLPDRLEARINCSTLLDNFALSSPRSGLQLRAGSAELLAGPPGPAQTLGAWLMQHTGFDERTALFGDWCSDAKPRAQVLIEDTKDYHRDDLGGADPQEQRLGPPPPYVYTTEVIRSTALARVAGIDAVEVSTALSAAEAGQQAARFFAASLNPIGRFPIQLLHTENGTATDQIDIDIERILERVLVTLAPETAVPEGSNLSSMYRLDLPGVHAVRVKGDWRFGFPNVKPIEPAKPGAVSRSDGAGVRPMGLTSIAADLQLTRFVEIRRRRSWFAPQSGPFVAAGVEQAWRLDESWDVNTGGLDAAGHVVMSRPPTAALLAALPVPADRQTITAVQSPLRIVDYSAPASQLANPWMARPGDSAAPHSFAFNLAGFNRLQLDSQGLVDQNGRPVPVFRAGDGKTFQAGTEVLGAALRMLPGTMSPAAVSINEFEEVDYQDAPAGPLRPVLALNLSALPDYLQLARSHSVVAPASSAALPLENSTIELRSFPASDPAGPPIGAATLTAATLDTGTNIWIPAITTVDARFTALPSFIWLQSDANLPIDHFPVDLGTGTADQTHLDAAGWATSRLQANASGPIGGTLTTVAFDARTVPSIQPAPFAPPGGIKWTRTAVAKLSAKPVGAPLPVPQWPRFAVLSGESGAMDRDEKSAVALYAQCNGFAVDGEITSDKAVGIGYVDSATFAGSFIDPAVVTLSNFSGTLAVQERDTDLTKALLLALVPMFSGPGLFVFLAKLAAGVAIIDGVFEDNSPIRVDALCSGDWYIKPSDHSLGQLGTIIKGFKHDTTPGDFDLNAGGKALILALAAELGLI